MAVQAADIHVRVDRDPVAVDESFQVTFEAEGSGADDPEFAPLQKDFQVLSRSQSSNLRIINGDTTSSKLWTLTLLARRTGKLTIPSIAFGGDRSPELALTVAQSGAGRASSQTGDVFLEVEAGPLKPFVQSQVTYVVRLFRAVATANASLSDPAVERGEAVIEKLGEDRSFETRISGRRYHVVERSYGIYPQTSGELAIAPVQFQGQTGRDSLFSLDPFAAQPRTIIRQSAPVTLNVQPIPDGFSAAHWLPAQSLKFTEQWSVEPPAFRVGEPITRTLTVVADGLTASQLPEIRANLPGDFKTYPDQPLLSDDRSPAGMRGSRQEKVAIIPGRPGNYRIPEIQISWYNLAKNRAEVATIPGRDIKVLPAPGTSSQPAGAPQAGVQSAQQPAAGSSIGQPLGPRTVVPESYDRWLWFSAFLAVGWLLTAILWWRSLRRKQTTAASARAQSVLQAMRNLKRACEDNNAAAAKDALLEWSRLQWPRNAPHSIGDLARSVDGDLAAELQQLSTLLYGARGEKFRARELWTAFNAAQSTRVEVPDAPQPGLEPLYRIY